MFNVGCLHIMSAAEGLGVGVGLKTWEKMRIWLKSVCGALAGSSPGLQQRGWLSQREPKSWWRAKLISNNCNFLYLNLHPPTTSSSCRRRKVSILLIGHKSDWQACCFLLTHIGNGKAQTNWTILTKIECLHPRFRIQGKKLGKITKTNLGP